MASGGLTPLFITNTDKYKWTNPHGVMMASGGLTPLFITNIDKYKWTNPHGVMMNDNSDNEV